MVLLIIIVPTILFPPAPRPPRPLPSEGDAAPASRETAGRPPPGRRPERTQPAPELAATPSAQLPDIERAPAEQVIVSSPLYTYQFSTRGARLTGGLLGQYQSFSPDAQGQAQLIPNESEFLSYSIVTGSDTVELSDWHFEPSTKELSVRSRGSTLSWVARRADLEVRLRYHFMPDDYRFHIDGEISGLASERGLVLVGLGPRLASVEADSALDFRSYGLVTKSRSISNLKVSSLDPGEVRQLSGPFEWVALKSKYFVAAIFAIEEGESRFGGVLATGGDRDGRFATRVHVRAVLPVPSGRFSHSVYVGPQEYERLARIGHDFEDVNPYGWILRPIIAPFAVLIVKILIWMHETLALAYGWVLVVFGIAVRLLLWPLNQKAMRSSMAMQVVQPELKALQERYKTDPQRLQQEMMKLYKKHGVNPLGGCLPLLLPMPVLFALFFVFANTIEFRGVPFLWLPDLSSADPLHIIPLVMGASMWLVTHIGQQGLPPNPQTKMLKWFMPIMLTVLFFNFSSGLNLYYAVQNIASLPQQWLIARERGRRLGAG